MQMVVKLAGGAKWLNDKPVGIAMLRSMTGLKARDDRCLLRAHLHELAAPFNPV